MTRHAAVEDTTFGWHGTVHRLPSSRGESGELIAIDRASCIRNIVELAGPGERAFGVEHAHVLTQIRGPHLLRVHEIAVRRSGTYLVTEHIDGEPLAQVLEDAERCARGVPIAVALRIILDVLEGISQLYGFYRREDPPRVHGLLCPEAILVGADGRSRIARLGGVPASGFDVSSLPAEHDDGYLAPEQWLADDLDERTDVFAAGVLLWELLAGRRLFKGSRDDVLFAVTHGEVPPPSTRTRLSSELHFLCVRALAPVPDARIPSAAAFARTIEDLLTAAKVACTAEVVSDYLESRLGDDMMIRRSYLRIVSSRAPSAPALPPLLGTGFDDDDATRPVAALWALSDRPVPVDVATAPALPPPPLPTPAIAIATPALSARPEPREPRSSALPYLVAFLLVATTGAVLGFFGETIWGAIWHHAAHQ